MLNQIKEMMNQIINESKLLKGTYGNDLSKVVSVETCLLIAETFLCCYIDLFSAYYTQTQVLKQAYIEGDSSLKEELNDFMSGI